MKAANNKMQIAVIGDYMIDKYVYVEPIKISQEAPVLIVKKTREENRLGGAGNVANNLVSLGVEVTAYGVSGIDKELPALLHNKGIKYTICREQKRDTTIKMRIVSGKSQLIRIDKESTHEISVETINEFYRDLITRPSDGIIISDYAKGCVTFLLINRIGNISKPLIINGKPENIHLYRDADVLILNYKEAEESMKRLATASFRGIPEILNLKYLVVTRGKDGIEVYKKGSSDKIEIKGHEIEVTDITGAGDVIVAMIGYKYIQNKKLDYQSLSTANTAAAKSVEKFGTSTVDWDEIEAYYREQHLKDDGV